MSTHNSVLLTESIAGLHIHPDGIYVDGTLGRGGHSAAILKQIPQGQLYAFDRDETAIEESRERLYAIGKNVTFIHKQFSCLKAELEQRNVYFFDGMLLDLGVSSPQFDDGKRGFSYRHDAILDMRMDQTQGKSAYDVVNTYDYHALVRIFYEYGEEKAAKQIARNIEKQRSVKPIETTFELVDVIKAALPQKVLHKKGHPAKKVFQAIRMEVNEELSEVRKVLQDALSMLQIHGRLCVISFHSLEDRIVKEAFHKVSTAKKVDKRIPLRRDDIEAVNYRLITRKPIMADEEELEENRRSHSAKLRIIERVG